MQTLPVVATYALLLYPDNTFAQAPVLVNAAKFVPSYIDDSYQEKFPYIKTREVVLRNVTTASGKALRVSDNKFMFKDVKVEVQ